MEHLICIVCPNGCRLKIERTGEDEIHVEGNLCPRGISFAKTELTNPTRSLTTTVRTNSEEFPALPVRTDGEIPKDRMMEAILQMAQLKVQLPVCCGDVVLKNLVGSGVNVIATCTMG